MTITRVTGNAVTYGGYVNVSRQNIDFSSPQAMDAIVNDLAAQYAVQTEAALGAALDRRHRGDRARHAPPPAPPTADGAHERPVVRCRVHLHRHQGRRADRPRRVPDEAGLVGQRVRSGEPAERAVHRLHGRQLRSGRHGLHRRHPGGHVRRASRGAATDFGVLFSTAAVEVYEQRVGTLSVVEPSVLGVQVAYAGYFTPMIVESTGIRRIVNEA